MFLNLQIRNIWKDVDIVRPSLVAEVYFLGLMYVMTNLVKRTFWNPSQYRNRRIRIIIQCFPNIEYCS